MNLLPLANILEDKAIGIQGTDIFVHFMPPECLEGVLLRNINSGTKEDYELPGYYKTEFTAIVRTAASTIPDGEEKMREVIDALTIKEEQVEDMYFNYIRPKTMPMIFSISAGKNVEIMTRFSAVFTTG